MSSSEQEFSDNSYLESPPSTSSAYSAGDGFLAPEISTDDVVLTDGNKPSLLIIEQPEKYFRFRYKSEGESGTHGCLMGIKSTNVAKTYPTVELVGYTGQARIKCHLYQTENHCEHVHQLLDDEPENFCSTVVPEKGSYKVCFRGMGIIHTAKKDVPAVLLKKLLAESPGGNKKKLREQCKLAAKKINLNSARLRFSAHDMKTDAEICSMYSNPIQNSKSVASNPLKICRISRTSGRPQGGDDLFLLVDKVSSKNIKVIFYELDENGDRCWEREAHFLDSDVHHQYAIVCRSPTYKNANISSNVRVFIELLRPTDGETSSPKEFVYLKNPCAYINAKKRKIEPFGSSQLKFVSGCSRPIVSAPPAAKKQVKIQVGPTPANLQSQVQVPPFVSPQTPQNCGVQPTIVDTQRQIQNSEVQLSHHSLQTLQNSHVPQQIFGRIPKDEVQMSAQNMNPQKVQSGIVFNSQAIQSAMQVVHSQIQSGPRMEQLEVQQGVQIEQSQVQQSRTELPNYRVQTPQERQQMGEVFSEAMQVLNDKIEIIADETVTADALHDLISEIMDVQETQPTQSLEAATIFTDANVRDGDIVLHDFKLIPTSPAVDTSSSNDQYEPHDLGSQPATPMIRDNNPMFSQGQPNIIEPSETLPMDHLNLSQADLDNFEQDHADFIASLLHDIEDQFQADSAKREDIEEERELIHYAEVQIKEEVDNNDETDEHPYFKAEDHAEIEKVMAKKRKKLIKEILEILRNEDGRDEEIRQRLERLCDIRMSNGDTFLHMTLSSSVPIFEFIVKLIQSMKLTQLLDLTNDARQTILHLAVALDRPALVTLLLEKGCDPMLGDKEGNNAVHYAVLYGACLEQLLCARHVPCDLDAYNHDKQTALHLSAVCDRAEAARALLAAGASYNVRDSEGRTPMHLAAYGDCIDVACVLIQHVDTMDIDAVDNRGYTALQVACGGKVRKNTLEIIKLLLEHKADPLKSENNTKPAVIMAKRRLEIWKVLREHVLAHICVTDNESEDEFHSADEGDPDECVTMKLQEMKL